jgi:hypothetical protein
MQHVAGSTHAFSRARRVVLFGTLAFVLSGCSLRPAAADPVTAQGHTTWSLFGV